MIAILFLAIGIPLLLIIGGIVAFAILPVKAGIVVAILAFIVAVVVFSIFADDLTSSDFWR